MPKSRSSSPFNPEQASAITHTTGPLLVIAGAGTGKTTVITHRIQHLISSGQALPEEILALTFTEKAATEMETRVDQSLPYGYTQTWIMTFHAFCDRVLRDDGFHIGINPQYRLLTDTQGTALLRRYLFDLDLNYFRPLGNPHKFVSSLLTHFSRLRDEDVSPERYRKWASSLVVTEGESETADRLEREKYLEIAKTYSTYQSLKEKSDLLDFADLIVYTLRLFRTRPNILRNYQSRFKYLLVDEFQDTNFAQNELVNLLASSARNLTVVADDDQAIYRWRGAAISNVIQFKDHYPDSRLIVLTRNYRSTQGILDRAYSLIQHNNPDRLEVKEKIDKHLIAARREPGHPVEYIHSHNADDEADQVARKIRSLLDDKNSRLSPKDFAILVRANSHAESFIRALDRAGLPYQFLGPTQLFHQPEVKDLISYLRFLSNLEDDASFYRVLTMTHFNLSSRDLSNLLTTAKKYNLHLFEICELLTHPDSSPSIVTTIPLPIITPSTLTALSQLTGLVHNHLALVPRESAGQILFKFLEDSGILRDIIEYRLPLDEHKAANIMKFFNRLKSLESTGEASLVDAVNWIDLVAETTESTSPSDSDWSQNDAVNITTIHSAKGLEFPVVFLVSLVTGRFPSLSRREPIPVPDELTREILPSGDYHLEEERRLFYVGMTRSRDRLYLSSASFYGEGKREKKLSPFVAEALGYSPQTIASPSKAVDSQLSLLDLSSSPHPSSPRPTSSSRHTVSSLSYSQIQSFIDCPLHYKARYILSIPTLPTASLSFGNSIHLTLKDFYTILKTDAKSTTSPDQLILELFKRNWSPIGFKSKKHAQLFYQRGEQYLKEYITTQFRSSSLPILLEHPFQVPLASPFTPLKIRGKIDRVDVHPDGVVEIIDYKTGANVPTQKEVDNDLQMSFYALAATSLREPPFGPDPAKLRLTLYYFDTQTRLTTTRTGEQLDVAREKILSYASEISASDFHCSGSLLCKSCEYSILCDPTTAI